MFAGMSEPFVGSRAVFLVECFVPTSTEDEQQRVAQGIRAACTDLRAEEADVAYLGAIVVPDDEIAFHVFTAADAGLVLEACSRAALRVERVVHSVAICGSEELVPLAVEPESSLAHAPGEIGP